MKTFITLLSGLLLTVSTPAAQPVPSLDKWQSHSYQAYLDDDPEDIVGEGNNWQILHTLRNGGRIERLDSLGIKYTGQQILRLEKNLLLDGENGYYRTTITILDEQQTAELEAMAAEASAKVAIEIEPGLKEFINMTAGSGDGDNSFCMVFSALDHGLWRHFETSGLFRRGFDMTAPWTGYYWITYPAKEENYAAYSLNTMSISELHYVATPQKKKEIEALLDTELTHRMVDDMDPATYKLTSPDIISGCMKLGLCDRDGNMLVPVFNPKSDWDENGSVFRSLGTTVFSSIENNVSLEELCDVFEFADGDEALFIFYYHTMWHLIDRLMENGTLALPQILEPGKPVVPGQAGQACHIRIFR